MDKYQIFALKNAGYSVWTNNTFKNGRTDKPNNKSRWSYATDNSNMIIINQDEDYNILKHYILFDDTVAKVIIKDKEFMPHEIDEYGNVGTIVPVDFNNQIKELTLYFYEVIDPISIPVKFISADKKIFDDKVEKERQKGFEEIANITLSTGSDLVNVYFQPCSDNYEKTTIELWLAKGGFDYDNNQNPFSKFHQSISEPIRMIGKFKVEEVMMFKSITGLAKGVYGIVVSQYDNKGNLLFKSNFKYFHI